MPSTDETRSGTLVELLPAALYTCEAPSGRITFFNAHAARLWGREPRLGDTDARFCGSFKLWRPDGRLLPHHETPMAVALLEGTPARNEEVIIERPDVSRVTVVVNIDPLFDAEGRITCAINVFHDATPMKSAEEARLHLAAIVDSSDDAIVSKDLNGIITSWNQGARRIFGYTAEEAVGRAITILIPEERQGEEPDILARIRRGERIEHYETVRRRKDGTRIDISLTVSPILDRAGRVIGASKIARDITERVQAPDRIARAREDAEAANRSKDEFLAMLGHELRNPLSPILTAIHLMRMRGKAGQEVELIDRQLRHLMRLVDDLLDVSRITGGKIELRRQRLELASVALRGLETSSPLLEQRRQKVDFSVPVENLLVDADPDRLAQVISNLITNASKYSEPGSNIAISAERVDRSVHLRVVDNGIGIAPEMLDRIFDLFVQQPQALDRSKGGLGLGLTIVRSLIELHGGTVQARSQGLGHGSEFTVALPLAVPDQALEDAPAAQLPRSIRTVHAPTVDGRRVLIVDDNGDAAQSIAEVLTELGHEVHVAHDGPTALALASRFRPDVCLLDIGLPVMDGYELARRLRDSQHLAAGARIIALTGYGQDADRQRSTEAGFTAHVVKPVDLDVLTRVVN
jgi:PAS domain S-box-containing protein